MAFVHGKDAAILLDGVALSGYLNSVEPGAEVDTAETTTFQKSWKEFIAGTASQTVTLSGFFDPTFNAVWALIGDAPGNLLTIGPGGLALGSFVHLVKQLTASYGESADIGDAVTFDWEVQADGPVGFGRIIDTGTITTDGNGASYDYTAQTTAGGVAHLHVTSVSASDSIVTTIEDSANGSSGWATIGTFASKSAAGAERILIPGTIRRYVRAVDDVTGSDVSIVRTVALARL